MENFKKIIRPGKLNGYNLFVKIEYTDGKLSLSGVVGPRRDGNACGGCGQIVMEFKEYDSRGYYTLSDICLQENGWTEDMVKRLFDIWDRWHLNDMRPGCEHQRNVDTTKEVEVVSYKLTYEAQRRRKEIRSRLADQSLLGNTADMLALSDTDRALAGIDKWWEDIYTPVDADSLLSGCYEVSRRETKGIGWVYPHQHPEGMMCKPCSVCNYKYGSAWLKEEVPHGVLEWLRYLPKSYLTPAWC